MREKKPEGDRYDRVIRGIICAAIVVSIAGLGLVIFFFLNMPG